MADNIESTITLLLLLDILIIFFVLLIFFWAIKRFMKNSDFPTITERWPSSLKPTGKEFFRQNIALNSIWYKNCANLIIADEGLYISIGFPLSLINKQATLIPWKYLSYQKKSRSFWTDVYEYQINSDLPVTLTVMAKVANSFPDRLKPIE